ncbi:MAG: helix-turn-helix domain-containing protein [Alphaproteobacteria bacterium]|nr:helix-turn-helix domain-containing protein [Alphaproteobacteria bacterium]
MTQEEIVAAALSDPDCPPSTPEQLAQFRRAVNVKAIREKLGLTQDGFARRFNLDVRAVQDWEQDRRRPDRAARTLLRVIDANPKAVERALRKVG